jgi:hypothetical protein
MTKRTSPSNGHTLKSSAFRTDIGLSETEFTMFKGLELSETRLANGKESSSNQLQNHTTSTPWVNHRRVRSTLSP